MVTSGSRHPVQSVPVYWSIPRVDKSGTRAGRPCGAERGGKTGVPSEDKREHLRGAISEGNNAQGLPGSRGGPTISGGWGRTRDYDEGDVGETPTRSRRRPALR